MTNQILREIIEKSPEDANEAAEMLLKQNPSNVELFYIIEYTDFKKEAFEMLRQRHGLIQNDELLRVIRNDPKKANEAAAQLLKQNPGSHGLCDVIQYTDLKNEAAEMLLKQDHGRNDLRCIMEHTDLKNEAAKLLLKQNPSNNDLLNIIKHTDLKKEAWNRLLEQDPHDAELLHLIRYSDLKNEAFEILRQRYGLKLIKLQS